MFAFTSNGSQMIHQSINAAGATGAVENLGTPNGVALVGNPTAVSWGKSATRIDVFARGSDNQLWQRAFNGGWVGGGSNGWYPLGGQLTSSPTVTSWGTGRLDIFALNTNGNLAHKFYDNNAWNNWESGLAINDATSFVLTTAPAAVSWGPGRIDIFARATGTNGLFQKVYANSWQPTWYDMSISGITSAPAVASSGVGQLDIYLRGVADDLRHRSYTAATGWSAWTNAAGTITAGTGAAPAATNADYPGYTFLVLRDTHSGLRYRPLSN